MRIATNTKEIPCPYHQLASHKATLFCWPHSLAGTWGCPVTNESGEHDHIGEDIISEEVELWPSGPEDIGSTELVEYYAECGVPVHG